MLSYAFILLFIIAASKPVVAAEEAKCECGLFKKPTAETTTDSPIVSKAPHFNFACDADGKKSCSNMCEALAVASRKDGKKKICELITDSPEPFTPMAFYKACDDNVWTYTGMEPTIHVCCKNKEVIPCPGE